MKLAIITERANITLGGAERSVFELTARMALLGVDVRILAYSGSAKTRRVAVLGNKSNFTIKNFEKVILNHLENNHYDIIHSTLPFNFADVYQPRGGSYTEAAIRNAISYRNPVVKRLKLLTGFANLKRTSLIRAEKKLCQDANGPIVAALSKYVALQFKKHYNLPDERICIIPNGIRLPPAVPAHRVDRLRSQILMKLNLKQTDEPVIFLFAAHNFRLKGLANLIRAMAVLKGRLTKRSPYLVIAGRGKAQCYLKLARKLNVDTRILFLGPAGSIYSLLNVADVAILPTYYDPSSRFILEALAIARPVITTKYNGAIDLFTTDRHGKVIESPDDIGSLAEAMRYYCSTENLIAARKAIEEDNIKSKVSIETHCKKLLELYQNICNNKGKQN